MKRAEVRALPWITLSTKIQSRGSHGMPCHKFSIMISSFLRSFSKDNSLVKTLLLNYSQLKSKKEKMEMKKKRYS